MKLNKNQQRVYEWLNNELCFPGFADMYKGALFLIECRPTGYISFVAHTGRELMNRLARDVAGIQPGRVQYHQRLDELEVVWRDEWRSSNAFFSDMSTKGHLIPIDVCQKISILMDEHRHGRMRSSDADGLFFSTFLDYSDKDKIPGSFLLEWKATKKWFLEHTHMRKESYCTKISKELVEHFNSLDGYLYVAASSQYERLKDLNEILDTTNQ